MPSLTHFDLAIDGLGFINKRVCYDSADLRACKPPCPLSDSFESTIEKMKDRTNRREQIKHIMSKIAHKLIDDLEDREGWNGINRQQSETPIKFQFPNEFPK